MKVIGENRIADLWDRIKTYVDPKADKIPEVNHGTSDTTFTLTPNIMHIWGEVSSLTLTFPEDTNTVLDEFMFTFTSPSTPTTLTLPATIKWIQEPNIEAGKTYLVSVVNGLAGYLTDGMEISGGDENIIEEITVNGTTVPVVDKVATITGTVSSVTVNGNNYTPDSNGLVNLGTISGGEGGTGGEYNVIEGVTFNGTSAPITNKIAAITYTAPTLSKGTTTGSGNAVTDISVSGHTVTLTKGTTFLTSYTETDPTVPAAVKAITSTDISNWNNKLAALVSGTNIKTINGNSILGEGNLSISGASGGEANVIEAVTFNGTSATITNKTAAITASIPDDSDLIHRSVDNEFIYSHKVFYNKNKLKFYDADGPYIGSSTGTGADSGDLIIGNVHSLSISGPTDIDGEITASGFCTPTGTSSQFLKADGTVDSNTYLTSVPSLSKGTTTGSGNAVTDISVSGHEITLTKGSTFLTSHQNVKTISGYTITGSGNVQLEGGDIDYVPETSTTQLNYIGQAGIGTITAALEALDAAALPPVNTNNNGSILQVISGQWDLADLTTIYSGSSTPASSLGNNGDIYIKTS